MIKSHICLITPKSPCFNWSHFHSVGIGGNEATFVCWAIGLAKRGYKVTAFLPCSNTSFEEGVLWKPLECWKDYTNCDVLISFRDPLPIITHKSPALRGIFLGDRITPNINNPILDDACHFIWVNSNAHKDMYVRVVSKNIPLVVGSCGYNGDNFHSNRKKIKGRCVHLSSPYRGLEHVLRIWPEIIARHPQAELHITGGYTLWGYSEVEAQDLRINDAPSTIGNKLNIIEHGALPREEYLNILHSSELLLYPTLYEETCCIASLEAAAAGVVQVLSSVGALKERVIDKVTGRLIHQNANSRKSDQLFIDIICELLGNDKKLRSYKEKSINFVQSFELNKVLNQLEKTISQLSQ